VSFIIALIRRVPYYFNNLVVGQKRATKYVTQDPSQVSNPASPIYKTEKFLLYPNCSV
jgi:hypothetical protein